MPAARAASSREAPPSPSARASTRRAARAPRPRPASRRSSTAPSSFRVTATVMAPLRRSATPPINARGPRTAPRAQRSEARALGITGEGLRWTLCDPLKSRLAVANADGASAAELARHLAGVGGTILYGVVGEPAPGGPLGLRPLTCVEIVKRLLGVSASGVLTPHQLYRSLLMPEPGRPAFVPLADRT